MAAPTFLERFTLSLVYYQLALSVGESLSKENDSGWIKLTVKRGRALSESVDWLTAVCHSNLGDFT